MRLAPSDCRATHATRCRPWPSGETPSAGTCCKSFCPRRSKSNRHWRRCIEPASHVPWTADFKIAHPLVRSVVFSTTPAGRKRELFARAAELCPDAPLEVRARQAVHAGSALEALALLDALSAERAANADLAGSVSALRQALDVARRELHRGELDDPTDAVLVFARKLAEALGASQRWSDAEGILNEALGTAAPASGHRAHLLGALARVANARAHPREARRYLDEAMRVARQSDARELLPILEQLDKSIAVA